ncbi:MAG: cysteine sulfinate desulfinase [Omnitrophica bacterium RIFOXYB12_FULL_50_7]|nr:MAG: cysteine sulfinate desulfinase [Omnitrophica bacterium RIFOXYB12_FULL_50_7]
MDRSADAKIFDVEQIRKDFPILREQVYGKPLTYLDNAATTQKPLAVIDTLTQYYSKENANIHRGIFCLSEQATKRYKSARHKVQEFLGAASDKEIIFVRGTTEALNLVAQCYGRTFLKAGDEVLITHMEHHSNIVPWQMLSEEIGIKLKVVPINDQGELILEELKKLLTDNVKFVAVVHISNALGTINPVKEIIRLAHAKGIPVVVDGAQAVAHTPVNVRDLDCDFYAFSGHKLLGPTGIGVLYGKKEFLEKMPPYQGGGDMIRSVTFEETTYNDLPYKFEAGTPHIAGVIGLGVAIDYISSIGLGRIEAYEQELLNYGTEKLLQVPGLRLIGTAKHKSAILSFVLGEAHAHDIGTILDRQGIAIRAGHHCAMPVMQRFNVPATTRASLAFYNTREEIDRLVAALHEVTEVFQ